MRIGHGFDAHAFVEGRSLILGGVEIPHTHGLAAHSDGDAVCHALCDALLGAAALGDLGTYFPDTDDQYKDIDSRKLLRKVYTLISDKGFKVTNVDITILAQRPRMAPYLKAMCTNLADDLDTGVDNVNIKATSTERMGYIGREEGLAVHAVTLLG